MADNVGIATGADKTIATDDVDGIHYQRVKIGIGADGVAADVHSGNPLPVDSGLPAAALLADGASVPTTPMIGAIGRLFNGTTVDFERGNTPYAELFASASRSGTQISADMTNHNARGLLLQVYPTVIGSGAMTVDIQGGEGGFSLVKVFSLSGFQTLEIYPGALDADTSAYAQGASLALPRYWRTVVTTPDAWTYSLKYAYIV